MEKVNIFGKKGVYIMEILLMIKKKEKVNQFFLIKINILENLLMIKEMEKESILGIEVDIMKEIGLMILKKEKEFANIEMEINMKAILKMILKMEMDVMNGFWVINIQENFLKEKFKAVGNIFGKKKLEMIMEKIELLKKNWKECYLMKKYNLYRIKLCQKNK